MKNLKLIDYIKINPELSFKDFDIKSETPKELLVTFILSNSGRVINNRIYPTWGQRDYINSWLQPFEKPILVHHKDASDPIGRFVDVRWESLEKEALDYLGNVQSYLEVKRAFDSKNPAIAYKAMSKYNLLRDKKWPGLGQLVATAKITDQDAIEKFLDKRYLTFSAGSRTDAYSCMLCGSDWHKGDICDHRPGETDDEGNLAIFMTGAFLGSEGSVVNSPANDLSKVCNLSLVDTEDLEVFNTWITDSEKVTYILTDAEVSMAKKTKPNYDALIKDYQELELSTLINSIASGKIGKEFFDALEGSTHYEIKWLISIHDALHSQYDYMMGDLSYKEKCPVACFKLHADIHDLSEEKGFRDSLVNGSLDKYDSNGDETDEYLLPAGEGAEDKEKDNVVQDNGASDAVSSTEAEEAKETEEKEVKEDSKVADCGCNKKESDSTDKSLDDDDDDICNPALMGDVDWYTLDLALEALVPEDAKLTTEKRKRLAESTFCGPEKSFPVNDCAHYTAAKRLLGRYKGPGDKKRILACIERRGKKLGCPGATEKQDSEKSCKCDGYNDLKVDYANALKQTDSLKEKLLEVLEALNLRVDSKFNSTSSDGDRLDLMLDWFGTIEDVKLVVKDNDDTKVVESNLEKTLSDIKEVQNPSGSSSEGKSLVKLEDLSGFEVEVLKMYKSYLESGGIAAAKNYFSRVRKYVSHSFNPNEFVQLLK